MAAVQNAPGMEASADSGAREIHGLSRFTGLAMDSGNSSTPALGKELKDGCLAIEACKRFLASAAAKDATSVAEMIHDEVQKNSLKKFLGNEATTEEQLEQLSWALGELQQEPLVATKVDASKDPERAGWIRVDFASRRNQEPPVSMRAFLAKSRTDGAWRLISLCTRRSGRARQREKRRIRVQTPGGKGTPNGEGTPSGDGTPSGEGTSSGGGTPRGEMQHLQCMVQA